MIFRFPEGLRKALTLSYDDGVEQDARLMALLDAHGLKCTFNLNSGCFPPEGHRWPEGQIHRRMTQSAAVELYGGSGHEVAVHTLTHPDLTQLPSTEMLREIWEDRRNLERLFGGMVEGAAYPYGTYSDAAVEALRLCGIRYCRTVWSSHSFDLPQDWLRLRPTCHHDDPELGRLCEAFLADTAGFSSRLFYLWGHAYEFEANNNWSVIERFAEKMGGHESIWYATNLDICRYTEAAKQLRLSADGTRVYNPTACAVWVEQNGSVLCIQPGETISLAD